MQKEIQTTTVPMKVEKPWQARYDSPKGSHSVCILLGNNDQDFAANSA